MRDYPISRWLLLSPLLLFACKTPASVQAGRNACKEVICTGEFKTITIQVVDTNDQPVLFDSHFVIRRRDKTVFSLTHHAQSNVYKIADDSIRRFMRGREDQLQFIGELHGKKIAVEYLIGADCCHVHLVSGPEKIIFR